MTYVFDHAPTKQEVFDQACTYFATSPGPSVDDAACKYRNKTGRCCVAGYFIPDDKYLPGMDNMPGGNWVSILVRTFPDHVPTWFQQHEDLLRHLQSTHDRHDCRTPSNGWEYASLAKTLTQVAAKEQLDDTAVNQVRALVPTQRLPVGRQSVEA